MPLLPNWTNPRISHLHSKGNCASCCPMLSTCDVWPGAFGRCGWETLENDLNTSTSWWDWDNDLEGRCVRTLMDEVFRVESRSVPGAWNFFRVIGMLGGYLPSLQRVVLHESNLISLYKNTTKLNAENLTRSKSILQYIFFFLYFYVGLN